MENAGNIVILTEQTTIKTTKFLSFEPFIPQKKLKTFIFKVNSRLHGFELGEIKWYGSWRQYAFFPREQTIFNKDCLQDITEFIKGLMLQRKK